MSNDTTSAKASPIKRDQRRIAVVCSMLELEQLF